MLSAFATTVAHTFDMTRDIQTLEAMVLQAVVDKDWLALADLLCDDFVITTAGWLTEPCSKRTWIREVSERHDLRGFDLHSVDLRQAGDVTVALVSSTQRAIWKGAPFEGLFRYTDVWCPGAHHPQLLARHATLIPA
jgi:ketosteroid isomerase-like protein